MTQENALRPSQNGLLVIVLNVSNFTPIQSCMRQVDELYEFIFKTPVDAKFSYRRVLIPGEPEWEARRKRLTTGISVPERVWKDFLSLANELHLDLTSNEW